MEKTESREPDELTTIEQIVDAKLVELHTCLPAKVERYDAEKQQADVTPVLKRVYLDEDDAEQEVDYPVITNVPVAFPRGGGFSLSWPLAKGDPVWLVFAERSLDGYLETDGATPLDPKDARRHNISDAVCYPGGGTFTNASDIAHAEDLVVGIEGGALELHIKPDGEVWWKAAKFRMGTEAAAIPVARANQTDARLDKLENYMAAHQHSGGALTSPPILPAPFVPGGLPPGGTVASERMFVDS